MEKTGNYIEINKEDAIMYVKRLLNSDDSISSVVMPLIMPIGDTFVEVPGDIVQQAVDEWISDQQMKEVTSRVDANVTICYILLALCVIYILYTLGSTFS